LSKLEQLKLTGNILIITEAVEENLYLASRNVPNLALLDTRAAAMDPVTLVRAEKVVITEAAIKELEELLK
jgi:large subunit ribosomal protein L4